MSAQPHSFERRHGLLLQNGLLAVISLLLAVTGFFSLRYYSTMEAFANDTRGLLAAHERRIDAHETEIRVISSIVDRKGTYGLGKHESSTEGK